MQLKLFPLVLGKTKRWSGLTSSRLIVRAHVQRLGVKPLHPLLNGSGLKSSGRRPCLPVCSRIHPANRHGGLLLRQTHTTHSSPLVELETYRLKSLSR